MYSMVEFRLLKNYFILHVIVHVILIVNLYKY